MNLPQRMIRVVPITLLALLAVLAAAQNNDDYCGTVGECLGNGFDDILTVGVVLLVGTGALWAFRTPHVVGHVLALLLVGGSLWYAAQELLIAVDPHRDYDAPLPAAVAVAVALAAGAVATYAVWPGSRLLLRLGALAAAPALAVLAHLSAEQVLAEAEDDAMVATGVTLYAPVIAGHAPENAGVHDDQVSLFYSFEVGGGHAFVDIWLEPAPRERELLPGQVEVVRGDTVLVADFDAQLLDPEEVTSALREAPEVSPEDLP